MTRAFVAWLLALLAACAPDGALREDAGPAGAAPDAGRADDACTAFGGCGEQADEACRALLDEACGVDGGAQCDDGPGCTAARLVSTYEPARCGEALADDARFPPCRRSACEILVRRVCGAEASVALAEGGGACRDAPGCDPALRLYERSVEADAGAAAREDALSSCAAGLEDDAVFAPCAG